jgi:hypothetical protein
MGEKSALRKPSAQLYAFAGTDGWACPALGRSEGPSERANGSAGAGGPEGTRSTGGAGDGLKDPALASACPSASPCGPVESPDAVTLRAFRTLMRGRQAPQAGAERPVSDGVARCACPGLTGGALTRRATAVEIRSHQYPFVSIGFSGSAIGCGVDWVRGCPLLVAT